MCLLKFTLFFCFDQTVKQSHFLEKHTNLWLHNTEEHSRTSQTSKMKFFAIIVHSFQVLTISEKLHLRCLTVFSICFRPWVGCIHSHINDLFLEKETHQSAQVSYPTKVGSLVSYKQPLIYIFISLIELKSIKTIH